MQQNPTERAGDQLAEPDSPATQASSETNDAERQSPEEIEQEALNAFKYLEVDH